jgi:hypothetical protein
VKFGTPNLSRFHCNQYPARFDAHGPLLQVVGERGYMDEHLRSLPGTNLIKASARNVFVPKGQHDSSLARSAWDSITRKNRPVGYGMVTFENSSFKGGRERLRPNRVVRVIRALGSAPAYASGFAVRQGKPCKSDRGRRPESLVPKHKARLQRRRWTRAIGLTRNAQTTRAARFGRSLSLPP